MKLHALTPLFTFLGACLGAGLPVAIMGLVRQDTTLMLYGGVMVSGSLIMLLIAFAPVMIAHRRTLRELDLLNQQTQFEGTCCETHQRTQQDR